MEEVKKTKTSKLYDVVLIRSFAIIMVVAFHAYGMMYADHFIEVKDVYYNMYFNINQLVLKFRMPLFIFISGYLFSYLRSKGKYPTFSFLLKNKFKRLVIPFWIFALVYMITTNSFAINKLWMGYCAHLWFLTMLFWCFVFTRAIELLSFSYNKYWRISLLIISFILLLYNKAILPSIIGLSSLTIWYFWFYLGYVLSSIRDNIYNIIDKYKIILIILLSIYILGIWYTVQFVKTDDIRTIFSETANLSIVILIWFSINWVLKKFNGPWIQSKCFNELNRTSYGIFVLHVWLQGFMVSNTAKTLLHLNYFASQYFILFPLTLFIVSLLLSYAGAWLMLKTKVGRFLIG